MQEDLSDLMWVFQTKTTLDQVADSIPSGAALEGSILGSEVFKRCLKVFLTDDAFFRFCEHLDASMLNGVLKVVYGEKKGGSRVYSALGIRMGLWR